MTAVLSKAEFERSIARWKEEIWEGLEGEQGMGKLCNYISVKYFKKVYTY